MKYDTETREAKRRIASGIGEFFLLVILTLIAPLFLYIDTVNFGHGVSELSFTEFAQEILLLISVVLLGVGACKYPNSRGLFVLMGGFFGCMLIRELDKVLDFVWHGFWFPVATLFSIAAICYAKFYCQNTFLHRAATFVNTKPYCFILSGLIVVLVFSRIFGSGSLLWKEILGEGYTHDFKSSLQEGLELFGYVFIAYGSFLLLRLGKKWAEDSDDPGA